MANSNKPIEGFSQAGAEALRQMAENAERFTEYLRFQGRVYKHSPVISLEFFLQRPDTRYIATEKQWKSAGFAVAHGSEGIHFQMPDGTVRVLFDYAQCDQSKPQPYIWRLGVENEAAIKQRMGMTPEQNLLQELTARACPNESILPLMERLGVSPEQATRFGRSFVSTVRTIIAGRLEIGNNQLGDQLPAAADNAAMGMLQTSEQRLAFLAAASKAARTALLQVEHIVTEQNFAAQAERMERNGVQSISGTDNRGAVADRGRGASGSPDGTAAQFADEIAGDAQGRRDGLGDHTGTLAGERNGVVSDGADEEGQRSDSPLPVQSSERALRAGDRADGAVDGGGTDWGIRDGMDALHGGTVSRSGGDYAVSRELSDSGAVGRPARMGVSGASGSAVRADEPATGGELREDLRMGEDAGNGNGRHSDAGSSAGAGDDPVTTEQSKKPSADQTDGFVVDEAAALTPAQIKKIERNQAEDIDFSRSLQSYIDGDIGREVVFRVGTTPYSMRIVGAKAIPVVIPQSVIHNSLSTGKISHDHSEGHGIPQDTLAHLPEAIRNPIFVCRGNRPNTLAVICDVTDQNGRYLLVAFSMDVQGAHSKVNRITTVFGKKNIAHFLQSAMESNDILAMNMKKAEGLFSHIGIQPPKSATILCFDDSITYSDENVKRLGEISSQTPDETSQHSNAAAAEREKAIQTERRAEILAAFAKKHGLDGRVVVQHNRKDDTSTGKAYDIMLQTPDRQGFRTHLFMKPKGTLFTEQLLLDSLAEFEQSQFFRDYLAARQPSFLFSPDELSASQPDAEPEKVDTNINFSSEQVRAEAEKRAAAMSDEEKRELMNYVQNAPPFVTFTPDVLAVVELIQAEEQRKQIQQDERLKLSPPARYIMDETNMPAFVDRMVAGDELEEIAHRILDNGEDAAAVAQDFVDASRYIISDHETFDLTTFAAAKDDDGLTLTAEPDSDHPFSVSYSWGQIGEFFREAAQLMRDADREAAEAWEREVAENLEAYDALDHHRDVYLDLPEENTARYPISDARKRELHNYRLHFEPEQGYLLLADSDTEDDLILRNFTMVGSTVVMHGIREMGFSVTGVETAMQTDTEAVRAEAEKRIAAMTDEDKRAFMNAADTAHGFDAPSPVETQIFELLAAEEQAAFAAEAQPDKIQIQVYQLPAGEKYHGIRYFSLADNKDADLTITDYDLTLEIDAETLALHGFTAQSTTNGTLESIMQTVNGMDIIPLRTGMYHSIAMSDVIVLTVNGTQTAYYCDTVGFTEMPDFFREKKQEQTAEIDAAEPLTVENLKQRYIRSIGENRQMDSYEAAGWALTDGEDTSIGVLAFFDRYQASRFSETQAAEIRGIISEALRNSETAMRSDAEPEKVDTNINITDDTSEDAEVQRKQAQNSTEQQRFASDLHALLAGDPRVASQPLVIGATPYALVICGADEHLSLTVTKSVIEKAMRPEIRDENGRLSGKTGHDLTEQQVLDVAEAIRHPIMVLKGSHEDSLVLVTEVNDNRGRNIVVAVDLNRQNGFISVNRISTLFGRDNLSLYLQNCLEKNMVLAADSKKADDLLRSIGLSLPEENTIISFDSSIAYSLQNVKYPQQSSTELQNNDTSSDSNSAAETPQQQADAPDAAKVDTNINPEKPEDALPNLEGLDRDTQEYIMTGQISQKKPRLSRPEQLYRLFARMYPEIVSGEHEYERYEAAGGADSGYEPLAVQNHGGGQYSWSTFYIQNGDLMADPDFCFVLDHENKRLEILSFQMDGVPPYGTVYQCCIDDNGLVDERLRGQLERTFEQNLRNAMHADRELVRYYDAEGKEVDLQPEQTEPSAETVEPEEPKPHEPEAGEPMPEIVYAADAESRAWDNIAAIRELIRLRQAEASGKPLYEAPTSQYAHTKAVSDEILRKYCGWGGLSHVFDEPAEDLNDPAVDRRLRSSMNSTKYREMVMFKTIRDRLKAMLTPEEYAAARASSTDSFYTPQYIIDAMYRAVQSMGLPRDSRVLEPSCGTGNFIARMPHEIGNGGVVGIEIDSITAEIASRLNGDQENVQIIHSAFERAGQQNASFDLVIGNVPFGDYRMNDPDYVQDWLIHDAFFRKALDKVAPGGVVAFVTSSGTLDKKNPRVREFLAAQAELIGAVRLPNTAFSETGVTTDIIFLQKREVPLQAHEPKPDWCYTVPNDDGLMINSYFVQNPQMMLGTMRRTTFQDRLTCDPIQGADLEKQLNDAVRQLRAKVTVHRREQAAQKRQGMVEPWGRDYSFHEKDGKVYYRAGAEMQEIKGDAKKLDMIRKLIELRTLTRDLIDKQKTHISDEALEPMRQKLNELYDAFVKTYGALNSPAVKKAFGQDMDYPLLQSLEEFKKESKTFEKTDIFRHRTVNPVAEITAVDTLEEAYQVSLDRRGKPDIPYMAALLQDSRPDTPFTDLIQQVQAELLHKGMIFIDPEKEMPDQPFSGVVDRAEYLSGNVRRKLAFAEEAAQSRPEFQRNADALREVIPPDIQAEEITVRMGCTWIDPEDYTEFLRTLAERQRWDTRCDVSFSPVTGEFDIMKAGSRKDLNVNESTTYGTPELTMYEIAEKILNQRRIAVMMSVPSPKDPTKTVSRTDPAATKRALEKAKMIEAKFVEWIFADPARRDKYVRRYNDLFNSLVGRSYDGSGMTFNGMRTGFELRPHQKNCVARAVYGGNTLAAHVVGAGKSAVFATTVMKKKALGLIHKACVVVPKALTEQTAREWRKLYPDARLLTVTDMDLSSPKKRDIFAARIATGDFDAVILSQEQFEKMPMSQEFQRTYLQKQLDALEDMLRERRIANGNRRDNSTKAIESAKKRLAARLEAIMNPKTKAKRKDFLLDFEQLGFDYLVVDEAHSYKNGFVATKMGDVSGVSTKASGRAQDMQMKCDFLNDTMGQGHILMCTGTPVSNSMTELYVMTRYLRPDLLAAAGVSRFDDWAATFGSVVMQHKQTASGELKLKATFSKFANLPELMALYKEFADIQSAKKLNLPRPKLKTGKVQIVKVQATPEQRAFVRELAERAKRIASGSVDPRVDNPLVITSEARMLGLGNAALAALMRKHDMEVPDDLAAAKDSKVDACIEKVLEIYQETAEDRGVQIIFSDIAVNAGDDGFSVYDYIRDELIRRGIPAEEIIFAPKADSKNREDIFRDINDGKYRVVIASTGTLGTGANIQKRLAALHNVDIPWKPSDFEQREGRILRQGNMFPEVQIFNYITEGTLDSYLYQVVTDKARFIAQLMDDECPARVSEDCDEKVLTFGELQAAAEGNPNFKKRIELTNEIAELRQARAEHMREIADLRYQVEHLPERISALQERLSGIHRDIQTVDDMRDSTGKLRGITITTAAGKQISDREKINDYLHGLIQQKLKNPFNDVPEFQIGDFRVSIQLGKSQDEIVFVLKGDSPTAYKTVAGQSDKQDNCQRLTNLLDTGIAKDAENVKAAIAKSETDLEQAKARADAPFPYEQQLADAEQELEAVEKELLGISDMEDAVVDPDEMPVEETAEQKQSREEFFSGDSSDINPNTDSGLSDDDTSEDTPPEDLPPTVPPIR